MNNAVLVVDLVSIVLPELLHLVEERASEVELSDAVGRKRVMYAVRGDEDSAYITAAVSRYCVPVVHDREFVVSEGDEVFLVQLLLEEGDDIRNHNLRDLVNADWAPYRRFCVKRKVVVED